MNPPRRSTHGLEVHDEAGEDALDVDPGMPDLPDASAVEETGAPAGRHRYRTHVVRPDADDPEGDVAMGGALSWSTGGVQVGGGGIDDCDGVSGPIVDIVERGAVMATGGPSGDPAPRGAVGDAAAHQPSGGSADPTGARGHRPYGGAP